MCDVVTEDAVVSTDAWSGYNSLSKHGYIHQQTVLSDSGDPAHVAMPGVHRSLLTFQLSILVKYSAHLSKSPPSEV